jgi:muconolactone delta-isomerase
VRILALEHEVPGVTGEQFQPHLHAEAAHVWELYQAGVVRELYFRADRHEAVLVLECPDADAARDVLASLPLAQAGLITFEIIPLVAYPGFARLFAHQPP